MATSTSRARTSTSSRTVSATSASQVSNTNKPSTVSRNAVVVNPSTGNKQLVRNTQVTQNRGQVYQNGRMVADYGIGENAAAKARSFAASIETSPYAKTPATVTYGRRESAYTPPGRQVQNKYLQTGAGQSRQTTGVRAQADQQQEQRVRRPAAIYSKLAPVLRDQTAEDAARTRIATERGIDVSTAPASTLALLDEAVNQDVYGQARPKFSSDAITAQQKAQEQAIAAENKASVETPVAPVTPDDVSSIVTSDQAKTYRDSEIQQIQTWQADSFGTVSDGINSLISSDSDINAALLGGMDAQALLAERQAFYEEQYNSLKSDISRIYDEKAADYKIQAAQRMGSTISQLAAMGALGTTTAGIQYVNDVQRENDAKMLAFAAEEASALESAYTAFQNADFELAKEMIATAKATREEIRTVKKEQLENQKTMLELKKLEREDASQTIDAMVQSGLDVDSLPPGYLEHLDAKGGYAPGTSRGLWEVAQKERAIAEAKSIQEAQAAAIENAQNMATFLEGTETGGTVSLNGRDYNILAKGDVVTGTEMDAYGNATLWSYDKNTGKVQTYNLGNIGTGTGWDIVERNGVMARVNSETGEIRILGDSSSPNFGQTTGGIMDVLPEGSINFSGRHQSGSYGYNVWMDAQCGSFVNDMTGIGVGDTWADKQSKMTNDVSGMSREERLSHVPNVGDVFVQTIGSNNLGHVGIVNNIQPILDDSGNIIDYQLTLTESNWSTTKDPSVLQSYGIDPSALNDPNAASRGIGLVTHSRVMKLSDQKLTGFASPGFVDSRLNFGGTDGVATDSALSRFLGSTQEEPKVVTINGKSMVWDSASGQYIDAPISGVSDTGAAESARTMMSKIDELISSPGLNNAVGPNFLTRGYGFDTFTGAQAEFTGGVENLITNLTLEKLRQAKEAGVSFGALSDTELQMISNAATAISSWKKVDGDGNTYFNVSEDAFIKELRTIQDLLRKDAGQIKVQRKSDGQTGWLPAEEFNSDEYIKL